ncbi:MAG TPA: DUF4350 domain-containing protein [Pyrinomonadaceae bacterium]|nr:DUF4350 domain-containing protein [Pyrinomonadaceae bacterium]
MRGRLAIILTIFVVLVVLVMLNAASYVRVEDEADAEMMPNRSTFHAGPTGTRALYEFLTQSGYKTVRWGEPPSALLGKNALQPTTFVVIGRLRTQFTKEDEQAVLHWVEQGGRLVLIDRQPDGLLLLPNSAGWRVASERFQYPGPQTNPENAEQMTAGVKPVAPTQPTLLTYGVRQVAPSRFAARLHVAPVEQSPKRPPVVVGRGGGGGGGVRRATPTPTPLDEEDEEEPWLEDEETAEERHAPVVEDDEQPPPPPKPVTPKGEVAVVRQEMRAPVEHVHDGRTGAGALLVDYEYGRGRIVLLSDPYIIANSGISRADNLILGVNVVTGSNREGVVAFDEYHQGLGMTRNRALSYFAGTPVLGIFAQAAFIVLAVMWSRGRRFARPLPAPRVDRRSSLEFVASMAELQHRARAYDLAVENVYARTRRALARYGGAPATASYKEIAARVAARSGKDQQEIEKLLAECEDTVAGAPTTARRTLALVAALRELERELGIRMRSREIRQERERQK